MSEEKVTIQALQDSDLEMIRVLDDLIELMIDKGVIQFTELPEQAQRKLLKRTQLRQGRRNLDLLEDEESPLNY
ncbi:hypothetical protein [Thiomicrospira sp. ALE5]|uniref:hypothetical protein n=1 Tax=Thiomicrospira sp. ALE5 TaxID=748650 RepID=UPI000B0F5238|nr:hypothetical protein [Thiomicrospira sp. ALE5]